MHIVDARNLIKPQEDQYFLGVDLGQQTDYTAIAAIQKVPKPEGRAEYHLRMLQRPRLGTPYPVIVEKIGAILNTPPLQNHCRLVVDGTGVGVAVVDLLKQAQLKPVSITITGGNAAAAAPGGFSVPKRDLASIMQVVLQTGRFKVADGMPEAATLVSELLAFKVKISDKGHDTYEAWREGAHDDTVLAVAIAVWYAERQAVQWKAHGYYAGASA